LNCCGWKEVCGCCPKKEVDWGAGANMGADWGCWLEANGCDWGWKKLLGYWGWALKNGAACEDGA
jgi:hypothetical protein